MQRMNESEGKVASHPLKMTQANLGTPFKTTLMDKNQDLMHLFRKKDRHYGWYFDEQDAIKKRFTPKKWKPNFDELMLMGNS